MFSKGEINSGLLTLGSTFCSLAVVILGIKYGLAKFSVFDGICQFGAIVALVLWLIFKEPVIAILITVAIDLLGLLPTLRHSWIEPAEETWQTFFIGSVAATFTLASLHDISIISLPYPLYLLIANSIVVAIVVVRRRKIRPTS